jgi:ribonuclease P protein component
VPRANRLTRSRDFDAVYRRGRSTSTRYLVLYWFPREGGELGSRLGIAIPRKAGNAVTRNRLKRRLREAWRALPDTAEDTDYVLVARPGLAEASEARGLDWLRERVEEALGKAAA